MSVVIVLSRVPELVGVVVAERQALQMMENVRTRRSCATQYCIISVK